MRNGDRSVANGTRAMPYCKLYYHSIWGTKNRCAFIVPEVEAPLYRAIRTKIRQLNCVVHAVGGTEDHVHVVAAIPPKLALSRFVGEVKGQSSYFMNHVLDADSKFFWQNEYGVVTFAERSLRQIVAYVNHQRQHHLDGSIRQRLELSDEFRATFPMRHSFTRR